MSDTLTKHQEFIDKLLKEEHEFLSSTNPKDSTMPTKIIALYEEMFGDEDKQSDNQ